MSDNKPLFPGLRKALLQIMVAIAKMLRMVCYLLMAVGIYLIYAKNNHSDAIQMVIVSGMLALLLHFIERKYKKEFND